MCLACVCLFVVVLFFFFHDAVASFTLSEADFSVSEGVNAMMPVKISKDSLVRLANPVTFRVNPLTVEAALARSLVVPAISAEIDLDSPIQASEK